MPDGPAPMDVRGGDLGDASLHFNSYSCMRFRTPPPFPRSPFQGRYGRHGRHLVVSFFSFFFLRIFSYFFSSYFLLRIFLFVFFTLI